MRIWLSGFVLTILCCCFGSSAIAGSHNNYRDMYRDKRYAFLEIRTHQDAETATKCVLDKIYSAKQQKPELETREQKKVGGSQITMISWGKEERNSIDVESGGTSDARIRIYGWYPEYDKTGSFAEFEPCIVKSKDGANVVNYDVDIDHSLIGRLAQPERNMVSVYSVTTKFTGALLVDCFATYPTKTSYDYNGYYYSPQVIGYNDHTIRIGWYDSGNMVTPPGPIFEWAQILPDERGSKVSVYMRFKPDDVSRHWLVQLASSCALNGNSDDAKFWPRK